MKNHLKNHNYTGGNMTHILDWTTLVIGSLGFMCYLNDEDVKIYAKIIALIMIVMGMLISLCGILK